MEKSQHPAHGKKDRLTCKAEFDRVFAAPRKRVTRELVILTLASPAGVESEGRIGLVVSRKVGNAVHRNRGKRRLREIFRKIPTENKAGQDIVFIARPCLRTTSFQHLEGVVTSALASLAMHRPQPS